uniref:Uncharacterized protein n=1 Tax=Nelumbo nucifera TaxID=4432 RepID=A0A822YKK1_NELNU|nr:TPA_asm: hypothetical protein HUJ06_010346 [Nelumbo nucifera]
MSRKFLLRFGGRSLLSSSCFAKTTFRAGPIQITTVSSSQSSSSSSSLRLLRFPTTPTSSIPSSVTFRTLATKSSADSEESDSGGIDPDQDEALEDGDITDGWEEEDDADPQIGDGGDGGGIVLRDVPWGKRVLSIAHEILLQFSEDMKLFSFKTSPRGYIYVRLDKLSNKYGCPSMEEIENYSCLYKKRLEEVGQTGEIPDDLALEVTRWHAVCAESNST